MGRFTKGRHTYGGIKVPLRGRVEAGAFCSIADNVIAVMEGHRHDWISTFPFTGRHFNNVWGDVPAYPRVTNGDILIGSDVWIGQNVVLLSGITICPGAVIGAGAVVTKDVGPYEVVGGVPAKLIKRRFSKQNITELLKIAWWHWPDAKIKTALHFLMQNDIDKFINQYREG